MQDDYKGLSDICSKNPRQSLRIRDKRSQHHVHEWMAAEKIHIKCFNRDGCKYRFPCLIVHIVIVDYKSMWEASNCCIINSNFLCDLFLVKKLLFYIIKSTDTLPIFSCCQNFIDFKILIHLGMGIVYYIFI